MQTPQDDQKGYKPALGSNGQPQMQVSINSVTTMTAAQCHGQRNRRRYDPTNYHHKPLKGDSIVLEEEIDPNYKPTDAEVLEYARWLGMDEKEVRCD